MIVSAVIPARLASTRLPCKVLADIHGRPLLWHVWNQVIQARGLSEVLVATDSSEVASAVENWGGLVRMTSPECRSGTERIVSIIDNIQGDLILNIQGDEPLIDPRLLEKMVALWKQKGGDLITPVYPIRDQVTLFNPNIVKVVRAHAGNALYFSRSPLPYVRDCPIEHWLDQQTYWGHVGVYGYRREILMDYASLPESDLEVAERLEQLRFLDAGYRIQTLETDYHPIAVDTPADLDNVRNLLGEKI